MGPKYEFNGDIMKWNGYTLRRIRRISDGKLGGWIESEENLSQEGDCWIFNDSMVYDSARVYGNAWVIDDSQVYNNALVFENARVCYGAKVYGNAKVHGYSMVSDNTEVYDCAEVNDNARVYGNAKVYDTAKISGNAQVYGQAQVHGNARICGNAAVYDKTEVHGSVKFYGSIKITSGEYVSGEFSCNGDLSNSNESSKVVRNFIDKVNNSNKLTVKTEYDSIDEFFMTPITNNIETDTLIIYTVNTKEPLIRLQKIKVEDQVEFKFIIDITNKDGDDIIFRSMIKSQTQFDQLLRQAVELLEDNPKFSEYGYELEEGLLSL